MIATHQCDGPEFVFPHSTYQFLKTGEVYAFTYDNLLVNRCIGNGVDGGAANLWLRVHTKDGIVSKALIDASGDCMVEQSKDCLRFTGKALGIAYHVLFCAADEGWLWKVTLRGNGETADVIYGQDVGMADTGNELENELYAAQYLGHTIFCEKHGYIVCSRQNMAQNGVNPYLQIGMHGGKAVSYSTDAMQFFGTSYKTTNVPAALKTGLAGKNYQFECSYIALQSEKVTLDTPREFTFYGFVQPDCAAAVTALCYQQQIFALCEKPYDAGFMVYAADRKKKVFGAPYASREMPTALLNSMFPQKNLPEQVDGKLLSFFGPSHEHIVLKEKEMMVERPHANIITTFLDTEKVDNALFSSTCCIFGQFNGQTVVGNTSKHKLLSTPRGLLNIMKNSGMRIWIQIDGVYRLLTMPALFEMGINYCKWVYVLAQDVITVTSFAVAHSVDLVTQVHSEKNQRYHFIVTMQLVMGTHEFLQEIQAEQNGSTLTIMPMDKSEIAMYYPALRYQIHLPNDSKISDDRIFYESEKPQNGTMLTVQISSSCDFSVHLHGTLHKEEKATETVFSFCKEKAEYLHCYKNLLSGFRIEKQGSHEIEVLNETMYWYAHNAMVHFIAPHGLEQPGGAAWGTRDICQGPFELFISTQHFSIVRSILLTLFSHQSFVTGEWPQWFMFDRYPDEMDGCHGDVVFWPLKCMADYLTATEDYEVLQENLPFTHAQKSDTLLAHLKAAVAAVKKRFLPGTALISYAGGDWDDTLQPASSALKECLVSSWTQALAYQVLHHLGKNLKERDPAFSEQCSDIAQRLKTAFDQYLVIDGVIAGFVYRLPDGHFAPMLHPQDDKTGIHTRLLPMTRSIIANLSNQKLAQDSLKIVEEKLHCPDGVRLMDHPARYSGGVSQLFLRAEQAANVGREISLQYTHAHIRYIEALCCMGYNTQAWKALFEINPVDIVNVVKNAVARQRNMYYSSSDGAFDDRYQYDREFDKLMCGTVPVKGGWRLYSSGPGIYIHLLICEVLGLRIRKQYMEIDTVLPVCMDGLRVHLNVQGNEHIFVFHIAQDREEKYVKQNDARLPLNPVENRYRQNAVRVWLKDILQVTEIHIYA